MVIFVGPSKLLRAADNVLVCLRPLWLVFYNILILCCVSDSMAGKYERLDLIGSGTFGRAWLVRRVTSGRRYVLKEVKVSGLTERERGQTATEVQALARCRHVNVIRYREAFQSDSDCGPLLCIVMEYAEAGQCLSC